MEKQFYHQLEDYCSQREAEKKDELILSCFERIVEDMGKGKVVVVAGSSIDGRDATLYSLMKIVAVDRNVPSLILNVLKTEDMFYSQFLSNVANVSILDLRQEDFLKAGEMLRDKKLFVEFPTDRTVDNVLKIIKENIEKGVEAVFIDLYQSLTRFVILDGLAKELFFLARDLGINIFMGSSIYYERDLLYTRPNFQHLVVEGRLDEYSDLILGVFIPNAHNKKKGYVVNTPKDVVCVSILKNNINVMKGSTVMLYDASHNRVIDNDSYNRHIIVELQKNDRSFRKLSDNLELDLV